MFDCQPDLTQGLVAARAQPRFQRKLDCFRPQSFKHQETVAGFV